jgi:hypothetical protein
MDLERYFVVLHDGQWKIKHDEDYSHPYSTQREAIDSAIEAARYVWNRGSLSQVLVQDADMSFHAECTYGKDPYPPG